LLFEILHVRSAWKADRTELHSLDCPFVSGSSQIQFSGWRWPMWASFLGLIHV